ncbi:hypothetical protein ACWGIN_19685 [Streptomyces sp. NPDC054861]
MPATVGVGVRHQDEPFRVRTQIFSRGGLRRRWSDFVGEPAGLQADRREFVQAVAGGVVTLGLQPVDPGHPRRDLPRQEPNQDALF